MSKFYTAVPVSLGGLIEKIKEFPGAYVDRVIWNKEKSQVEVHWEHDALKTGLDHPVAFTAEGLAAAGLLPAGVTMDERRMAELVPELATEPEKLTAENAEGAESENGNQGSDSPAAETKAVRTSSGKGSAKGKGKR